MIYTVYAITSLSRSYIYVGITNDLERRLKEHNGGRNKKTKAYRPFQLIFTEKVRTRREARQKEKHYKSGSGKEFLKEMICPGGGIGIHTRLRA